MRKVIFIILLLIVCSRAFCQKVQYFDASGYKRTTTSGTVNQVLSPTGSGGLMAWTNVLRSANVVSSNITIALNSDYLNTTATQYTLTVPATTGFATQGSQIITALATGTGGFKIVAPSGYTIQTPSGNVTPVTGSATISQNQKIQLIPIGSNAYYLQPLNGTITVL